MINKTLGQLLEEQAQKYPDNDAVVYYEEKIRWTYAEFNDYVNKVAKGLIALGIKKGDHAAIWATNVPEWVLFQFATAKIGAVMVTVNTNYKIFELEYLLRQSDTKLLVLNKGFKDSDYIKHINDLCPELENHDVSKGDLENNRLPFLKKIVYIGQEKQSGMYNWKDLYLLGDSIEDSLLEEAESKLDVDDVINMQYTSGTTGFPKGVMLTHYNIVNNGYAIAECMNLSHEDRLCIPVPLFHCFGCVLGVMASVNKGTTMVFLEYYNPSKVMKTVEAEKCTALHGVPTMFIAMLDHPDFYKYNFSSLRTGIMAGSPCPIEVMKQVIEKMNMKEITIAYGQTEASPVITQTRIDDSIEVRVSTVGKPLPGIEVKIINPETGNEVELGEQGELIARGYGIMKGYYKMEEATKSAIDEDGWLYTGDLATMDEMGYFKITGRLRDMIIRGGENIYPREIEEFIYTHSSVKDVQVIGIPDEKYGEEVMAYIILKDNLDHIPDENSIIDYVKNGLSRYKAPRYVKFIDSYPMTASGKIQKYILRDMAIQDLKLNDLANIETS